MEASTIPVVTSASGSALKATSLNLTSGNTQVAGVPLVGAARFGDSTLAAATRPPVGVDSTTIRRY
jgi:hypothetical protein